MSFFDSEVVRAELTKIQELQDSVYINIFTFIAMSREKKLKHIEMLEELLDKQKILYTRLSLSDDPEAKEMKERILDSAKAMGLPPDVDMNIVFSNMSKMIVVMKQQIDNEEAD